MTTQIQEIKVPTMTLKYHGFNTTSNENMKGMHDYTVTLRYEGRKMQTQFHTGSAWTKEPTLYDVLNSLFSDADAGINYENVEDFAEDFGYDVHSWEDVKNTKKIFNACKRISESMKRLFNVDNDGFHNLRELYSENGIID